MQIKIEELSNGFIVNYKQDTDKAIVGMTKCYKYTDVMSMLEDIGKIVNGGKKVLVTEK